MPGSIKGLVSSPASMMAVVTDVEDMVDGGHEERSVLRATKVVVLNEEASSIRNMLAMLKKGTNIQMA